MANFIAAAVLLVIVGAAVVYLIRARKNGVKCIGCPSGCSCSKGGQDGKASSCSCGCGCGGEAKS